MAEYSGTVQEFTPETVSDDELAQYMELATEQSYYLSGAGSKFSQIPLVMSKFDRWGNNMVVPNQELRGYTFVTRPHLNMFASNLCQVDDLSLYNTTDPRSFNFAIRCLLDPKYCQHHSVISDMIDINNPFMPLLSNCITDFSGHPDFTIETETTEGGLFGEDLTFVKGFDQGARTYNYSLTVRDIAGGPIFSLFLAWVLWMGYVVRGNLSAHNEYIAGNRLCYTVSIYRFIMDPTKQYITKWSKATGCFPTGIPFGAAFDFTSGQHYVENTKEYNIPFIVNHVGYQKPQILRDFNALVRRYNPDINKNFTKNKVAETDAESAALDSSWHVVTNRPEDNFRGIPYIDMLGGKNQLVFMEREGQVTTDDIYESYMAPLRARLQNLLSS